MSGARVIGVSLLFFGLACGIVSTALDYWYYVSATASTGQYVEAYFGLWEFCATNGDESACTSWSSVEDAAGGELDIDWLHGCQAMMVIGALLNAAACLAAIFATLKQTSMKAVQGVAAVCAICYLIAAAIFGAKYEDSISNDQTGGTLHAGFGLAIVAGIINFIPVCVLGTPAAREGGYQTM